MKTSRTSETCSWVSCASNLKMTMNFFQKGAVSYSEYKAQCVAIRTFAFVGTTGSLAFMLFWNPPKSSYWVRYSPSYWPGHLSGLFVKSSPPLFLGAKAEGDNAPDLASQLITDRRIA